MKILIKHILIIYLIFVIWIIFQIFNIPCPSKLFFNIPCPACGTTRALFSIIKLDFKSYFHYNAMSLPIIICLILEIHRKLFKKAFAKIIDIATFLVFAISILYYFCRL